MAEKMCPGPVNGAAGFREAVCVHTKKVYDQCRSRDCMRDLRVYLPVEDQCFIEGNSVSVKPRSAELLTAVMDVEPVTFQRGFYSVDIRFYYKVSVEVCTGVGCPRILEGLSVYDKRCILFGSEGHARIFSSKYLPDQMDFQLAERSNLPTAVLEAVDAILLDAHIVYPTALSLQLSLRASRSAACNLRLLWRTGLALDFQPATSWLSQSVSSLSSNWNAISSC